MKYKYDVLSYWIDDETLYINYVIKDINNKRKANTIESILISYISDSFDELSSSDKNDMFLDIIKRRNGKEFELPKTSDVSPLLQYLYDSTCDSESNMCHIDYDDWKEIEEEIGFTKKDIYHLKKEIKKYNLDNYITIDDGEYMICCYGGLQCCFNDDRAFKRGYEFER